MTDAELLQAIDAFIADTNIKPTRLGLDALGDGNLVSNLRNGRSLTLRNAERLMRFMAEYQRAPQAAA
ncbi:hypothetical protein ACFSTI_24980 [Rhizorhabdus histidinilytica]|nr:hypothetical protein [Rhizorhabdus histidinilytica]